MAGVQCGKNSCARDEYCDSIMTRCDSCAHVCPTRPDCNKLCPDYIGKPTTTVSQLNTTIPTAAAGLGTTSLLHHVHVTVAVMMCVMVICIVILLGLMLYRRHKKRKSEKHRPSSINLSDKEQQIRFLPQEDTGPASTQCTDPSNLEAKQNQHNASLSPPNITDNWEISTLFNDAELNAPHKRVSSSSSNTEPKYPDMDRSLDRVATLPDNSRRTTTPNPNRSQRETTQNPNTSQIGNTSNHYHDYSDHKSPTPFHTNSQRGAMSSPNSAERDVVPIIQGLSGPTSTIGIQSHERDGGIEDTQQLSSMSLNLVSAPMDTASALNTTSVLDLRSYGPDQAEPRSFQSVREEIEYASQHEPENKNHWKTIMNMFDTVDQQIARLPFIAGMMLSNEKLEIHIRPNSEYDAQSCCNRIRNLMPPGKEHLLLIEEEPASMMTSQMDQAQHSEPTRSRDEPYTNRTQQTVTTSDHSSDEVHRTPQTIPTILTEGFVLDVNSSLPEATSGNARGT